MSKKQTKEQFNDKSGHIDNDWAVIVYNDGEVEDGYFFSHGGDALDCCREIAREKSPDEKIKLFSVNAKCIAYSSVNSPYVIAYIPPDKAFNNFKVETPKEN